MVNDVPIEERISRMIDSFSEAYGSARVAIYSFPLLQDDSPFKYFRKTFFSLLDRTENCRSFSWIVDPCKKCVSLILLVSGYFRNDVHDISAAAHRIWSTVSNTQIQLVADIPVLPNTLARDKECILNILLSSSIFPIKHQMLMNYHQRSFAFSRNS